MEDQNANMTDNNDEDNQSQMNIETLTVISKDPTAQLKDTLGQLEAQFHQVAPHNTIRQLGNFSTTLWHRVIITQQGDSLGLDNGNLSSPETTHENETSRPLGTYKSGPLNTNTWNKPDRPPW